MDFREVSALSANLHKAEWFLGVSNARFLESFDCRQREIDVDLDVFFLGETLAKLSERPDATAVVSDLRDNILRVLREILCNDRLGFFAGIRGIIYPLWESHVEGEG